MRIFAVKMLSLFFVPCYYGCRRRWKTKKAAATSPPRSAAQVGVIQIAFWSLRPSGIDHQNAFVRIVQLCDSFALGIPDGGRPRGLEIVAGANAVAPQNVMEYRLAISNRRALPG
jgi:hypothetical protein